MLNPRLQTVLMACAILALAIPAVAQNPSTGSIFGTPIKLGDADYTPVAKNDAFYPGFLVADFGGGTDIHKVCILMMPKQVDNRAVDLPPVVAAGAGTTLGTYNPRPDELRVSEGCPGGVAGSRIGSTDAPELRIAFTLLAAPGASAVPLAASTATPAPFPPPANTIFYAALQVTDLNNDGKYTAGEPIWVTYDGTNSNGGAAKVSESYAGGVGGATAILPNINGLQPTVEGTFASIPGTAGNTMRFTLRLTSQNGYNAGTFAMPGDADYVSYVAGAVSTTNGQTGTAGTKLAKDVMGAIERDDKAVFLVTKNSWLAGSAIPSGSVRLGPLGQTFVFPDIQGSKLELASTDPIQAGKDFSVIVTLRNGGAGGGQGVVVSRINGQIVDARMSPPISAGALYPVVIPIRAPAYAGTYELKINDGFLPVTVTGPAAPSGTSSSADVQNLQQRVADLEARLASSGTPAGATTSHSSPSSFDTIGMLGMLGLALAFAINRRRA